MKLKDGNIPGPWAHPAYVAPAPRLTNLGVQSLVNHVPGHINFRVGGAKVDYVTETAAKKKPLPAPNAYVPELHWKPANNFQKQTKTPKVTMTAAILRHKKQLGPGSHKVKFDSKYHGLKIQMTASSDTPQLMMVDHYRAASKETPAPTAYKKSFVSR